MPGLPLPKRLRTGRLDPASHFNQGKTGSRVNARDDNQTFETTSSGEYRSRTDDLFHAMEAL